MIIVYNEAERPRKTRGYDVYQTVYDYSLVLVAPDLRTTAYYAYHSRGVIKTYAEFLRAIREELLAVASNFGIIKGK